MTARIGDLLPGDVMVSENGTRVLVMARNDGERGLVHLDVRIRQADRDETKRLVDIADRELENWTIERERADQVERSIEWLIYDTFREGGKGGE